MRLSVCATAILAGSLAVIGLGGCAEDNDKSAKITSVPEGTDPAVAKIPKGVDKQKAFADEQRKSLMKSGYPAPTR